MSHGVYCVEQRLEQERRDKKLAAAREREEEDLEGSNTDDAATEATVLTDAVNEDAVPGEMEGIAGTREGKVVKAKGYERAAKPRPKRDPSEKTRMGA